MGSARNIAAWIALSAACAGALAQPSPADSPAQRTPDDDVARLTATLLDRSSATPRAARLEAARRLVQRSSTESRDALLRGLQERANPAIQAATATALADAGTVDPAFVDPLFVLVAPEAPQELARPAARALARVRSDPSVLTRLIDRLSDRRGEPSRRATVEALGAIPEKRSASALMQLLTSAEESREVRSSAVGALIYMTGARSNGEDVGRWGAWWASSSALSDADFRASIQAGKAARLDTVKSAYDELVFELREALGQAYRAAPAERRSELLLGWLDNPRAEIRAVGAMIVREDKQSAAVIPETVADKIRSLVSDSDENVRLNVATALGAMNYAPALEAMLAQLAVEPNPDVKASLARAIAPIQDLSAVPALVSLLRDQDRSVARAAAIALRDLGPKLRREGDTALLASVATGLRELLSSTGGTAQEDLREACVEAMVPLQRPELIPDLQQLLRPRESAKVRRSAVKALAQFGKDLADAVAQSLFDPAESVRLEAAEALAAIGRPDDIGSLSQRLSPANEPDESVRDAAWRAIEAILPSASTEKLYSVVRVFDGEDAQSRNRRIAVLKQLQANQIAERLTQGLAETREDLGHAYLGFNPPQTSEAILYYKLALDDYRQVSSAVGTLRMTESLMKAYLLAGEFDAAVAFANDAIARDPENIPLVGAAVRARAEELERSRDDAAALQLIARAEDIQPKLPPRFRESLVQIEQEIRRRNIDGIKDAATAPSGPRSASRSLEELVIPAPPVS